MAHKLLLSILYVLALLTYSRAQEHDGEEGETTVQTEPTPPCASPLEDIHHSIEEIFGANYTVYINCLSFDGEGALLAGVASGRSTSGASDLRFELECAGGIIVAQPRALLPFDTTDIRNTSCLECDVNAATGSCMETCAPQCERCYEADTTCTRCTACVSLEYEECRTLSNPTTQCRTQCLASLIAGPPHYTINHEQFNYCECIAVRNLISYTAAPSEQEIECEEEEEPLPSTCDPRCRIAGHQFDNETGYCFACGIPYCVECDAATNTCFRCLRQTVFYTFEMPHRSECIACPMAPIAIEAIEQEEEREHEEETNRERQAGLAISLPIVAVAIIVFFVSMSVFAHHRYPHVSYHGQKRHRRPPTTERSVSPGVTLDEDDDQQPISHVWRPRPTIVLR